VTGRRPTQTELCHFFGAGFVAGFEIHADFRAGGFAESAMVLNRNLMPCFSSDFAERRPFLVGWGRIPAEIPG